MSSKILSQVAEGIATLAEETRKLAQRLASGPTLAYAETKRLIENSARNGLESQLEDQAQAFARCARTEDMREGVSAFAEKRKPTFHGR